MKIYSLITVIIFLFLLPSCKEDDSARANEYAAKILSQLNSSDTFLFDFPFEDGKLDTAALGYLRWQEKCLNLPTLQKGFDSIQIRIWYGCALGGDRLVSLIHNGKNWKAELSNLTRHGGGEEGSAGYIDSLTRDIEYKNPKSGWIQLIDSLFDLKILTLPNDYDIPDFRLVQPMDGCGVGFEISTKNAYRFYTYANPQFDNYWQVKNVLQIIKLLSTEFNLSEWPEGPTKDLEEENRKDKRDSVVVVRELPHEPDTINLTEKKER